MGRGASFAARLQAARRRAGLTQEQLAAQLQVSVWSLRHWEQGVHIPVIAVYRERCERFIAQAAQGPDRATGWARHWAACRSCRTTERPHAARGYCETCYETMRAASKAAAGAVA